MIKLSQVPMLVISMCVIALFGCAEAGESE